MPILDALAAGFLSFKRHLASNAAMARAFRGVKRRRVFEKMQMHEDMLADGVRLGAYRAAIDRHIAAGDRVVDVGTGTGILAFLAAGRHPRKLYALDHSSAMLDYARKAAELNGVSGISFVASSSRSFRPDEPIDVILQEQMGIALFDEGMVETILDLRDRCLVPGGRILPAGFELYLEPVQLIEEERIPLIVEGQRQGLRFPPPLETPRPGYRFREIYPRDVAFPLCDPEPVFAFDLRVLTRDRVPSRFATSKRIVRSGQIDGIAIYFKAMFDGDIGFSTGPEGPRTHWPMLLYRIEASSHRAGEVVSLEVEAPDISDYRGWTWRLGPARDD